MSKTWRSVCAMAAATMLGSAVALGQDGLPAPGSADQPGRGLDISDVPHTRATIRVDGSLDEPAWQDALVIELGVEVNPRENEPAAVATYVYLIEDGARLLVGFDARDPDPESIRAYLRDRDTAYNDDFVGIVLDTFNDQRRGVEFFVNPLGVQMDLTVDDVNQNGGENDSWDAIWDSAGQIVATGYVVEMAIPFSQLRFQRVDGPQTWGVDALRVRPRTDRALLTATPRDRGRNCYLCQIGKVRGFEAAEPGRGLEVVPSLTGERSDARDPALGTLAAGEADADVGLNVRWAVTPDVVANLALNPDFSQVEADVAQLDVNNQFALFYPEARPFFLEGADFFTTPIQAVFTRTVADPDYGAKLTGTSGRNTFGLFTAEDTTTNLLLPGPLGSATHTLDQASRTFVSRYRRNFGASSTIGMVATSRSGDDYSNRVVGFDGRYRPTARHSVSFQYLDTATEYPEKVVASRWQPQTARSGDALQVGYEFRTREWSAYANYRTFDPGFRADSGFVSQVDYASRGVGFNRTWHGDGSAWWDQLRVGANTGSTHDSSGQLLSQWNEAYFSFQGPLQSFGQIGVVDQEQYWNGTVYALQRVWSYSQFRPIGGFNMGLSWNLGDQIDFANSRLGEEVRLQPWLNYNIGRHLLMRLQTSFVRLDDQGGKPIFDARLMDLRLTWQFSARSYVRATLQQQTVDRDLAQFVNPNVEAHSRTRGSQLLYSYQMNPQTVVFAGYSDRYVENDTLTSLTQTDRTLFLKLSYAWLP